MDALTIKNYEKIFKIVKNNFDLSEESLNRFKENLFEPDIDDVYKNIIGEDLRCTIDLKKEDIEEFDEGWTFFCETFPIFIEETNLTYFDFLEGVKEYNKNKTKLLKLIIKFYTSEKWVRSRDIKNIIWGHPDVEVVESVIIDLYNRFSGNKFQNKNMKLVLSLNFADWFLCSTAESWHSCLNLESSFSGSYWAGLPGLVVDKNRSMIFLSNEENKEYENINSIRMLRRTWFLLDENSIPNIVRFFPSYLNTNLIKKCFNIDCRDLSYNDDFRAKFKINLLDYSTGDSCFIYQDKTKFFAGEKNSALMVKDHFNPGGLYVYNKNNKLKNRTIFKYEVGLHYLIKTETKITNYLNPTYTCLSCNEEIYHGSQYSYDMNFYCERCFYDRFRYCDGCGDAIPIEEATESSGYFYCESCGESRDVD